VLDFVDLSLDRVDDAIRDMLRDVVLAVDLDRGTLLEVGDNSELWYPVSWTRPGLPQAPASANALAQFPYSLEQLRRNQDVCFSSLEQIPHRTDRASFASFGIKSALIIPIWVTGTLAGLTNVAALRAEREWSRTLIDRARLVAAVLGTVLARRRMEAALRTALSQVQDLRDRLHEDNLYLRSEARELRGHTNIIGRSAAVRTLLEQVSQVAVTDSSVLIIGETGTGKELIAEEIHELSARRARPMMRVNCAALPAGLLESELFGREKGAYTGADRSQPGRFELADGSTFFLDEVGDLPLEAQVKLLRVLEQKQIERLGSSRAIRVDTRLIAATHRDLEQLVSEGKFREDLFYRLNIFPIRVPPLRERVEDIPALVWHFVDDLAKSLGKQITAIQKDSIVALQRHRWPGNIRELRNVVERAIITARGPTLAIEVPAAPPRAPDAPAVTLSDVERQHIRAVLERTRWRIRGPRGAAEQLGLKPTTLETRMAKLGLSRSR
jgi:transcriptional regulator with GAF, ATPase, and Fis domain